MGSKASTVQYAGGRQYNTSVTSSGARTADNQFQHVLANSTDILGTGLTATSQWSECSQNGRNSRVAMCLDWTVEATGGFPSRLSVEDVQKKPPCGQAGECCIITKEQCT